MTAADIIAAQIAHDGWPEHEAGECGGCDASRHESAEHILAVLKAAGFEVVQLAHIELRRAGCDGVEFRAGQQ